MAKSSRRIKTKVRLTNGLNPGFDVKTKDLFDPFNRFMTSIENTIFGADTKTRDKGKENIDEEIQVKRNGVIYKGSSSVFKAKSGVTDKYYQLMKKRFTADEISEEVGGYMVLAAKIEETPNDKSLNLLLDDLPIDIFYVIARYLDVQSILRLSCVNSRLKAKLKLYRRTHIPLVFNIPKKDIYKVGSSSAHLFSYLSIDIKDKEIYDDYSRTQGLILNTIPVKECDGNVILSNLVKSRYRAHCLNDDNDYLKSLKNPDEITIGLKAILLAAEFDQLRILKVCVSNVGFLLAVIKNLMPNVVSLIVDINVENMKCPREVFDNRVLPPKKSHLRSIKVEKTVGRGFSRDPSHNDLIVSYYKQFRLKNIKDRNDFLLVYTKDSYLHLMNANKAKFSVKETLSFIIGQLIIDNKETLELIHLFNYDAALMLPAMTDLVFPKLVYLNVCFLSLPLLDTWLPMLAGTNKALRKFPKDLKGALTETYDMVHVRTFVLYEPISSLDWSACSAFWCSEELEWKEEAGQLWFDLTHSTAIESFTSLDLKSKIHTSSVYPATYFDSH